MSSIAFDTHAFIKCLTQAGMDEQQAEALVECQIQLINDSLATRLDIEEVKKEIAEVKREVEELKKEVAEVKREVEEVKKEIAEVKREVAEVKKEIAEVKREVAEVKKEVAEVKREVEELKIDMHKMELRLTIRLGSVIVVAIGIFATLIKLL